jgi:hypothetical protein
MNIEVTQLGESFFKIGRADGIPLCVGALNPDSWLKENVRRKNSYPQPTLLRLYLFWTCSHQMKILELFK